MKTLIELAAAIEDEDTIEYKVLGRDGDWVEWKPEHGWHPTIQFRAR